MAMSPPDVTYGGDMFHSSTPVMRRPKSSNRRNGSHNEENGGALGGDHGVGGGFDNGGFFSQQKSRGGGEIGSNNAEELRMQLRECQAKLVERTNELDAAKERNKLMEEHIESITDREDIVKANVTAIFYLALFVGVLLCCAGGAAWYYEPFGLPVANSMASRWEAACRYDEVCPSQQQESSLSNARQSPRGFLSSLFSFNT